MSSVYFLSKTFITHQFPDFSDCESIIGEAQYLMGGNTWAEITETELELI